MTEKILCGRESPPLQTIEAPRPLVSWWLIAFALFVAAWCLALGGCGR